MEEGEERGQRDKTSMISIAFLRAGLARLNNQHDLQKGHQAGDSKASIGDLQRVSENKEMGLVER
jgi:hypothetical protein